MFYLVQHKLQLNLKIYKKNLEDVVEERTAYLNSVIEELKLTQQYLVQNEKMISLGTFSAGIVHEINNPLNFISGGIQLISELKNEISKNKTVDFNERFENAINFINEGLFKTTSIVKALQSFTSRTTSKRIDSDIHKIIENSLLFLNFSIPENVSIIKNYHLKAKIPVFEDEIHQVIIEILRNALFELNKKTQKDSAIDITTSENEEFAILTISNNGGEIPEQYLSRVFDPFFTTKEPGEGVGLGLSIVYTFITEHKGKIRVENSNTWVKFIIELPFKN
ncbi:MAG: GHKL domain-containing protein [Bacteroidales bacterium]|nr:GHKL domain-containing protein [Bacteroidales bacterium]